jgi:hypothetical protein
MKILVPNVQKYEALLQVLLSWFPPKDRLTLPEREDDDTVVVNADAETTTVVAVPIPPALVALLVFNVTTMIE